MLTLNDSITLFHPFPFFFVFLPLALLPSFFVPPISFFVISFYFPLSLFISLFSSSFN